jgi:2-methylaconitate cis-trans-isomerase PrpF
MRIPATLMRGGTSKCWVFDAEDVPASREALGEMLLELFGSDDPRQLDGVGGGTSVTSKAMIVARSAEPDVDVEYLFAQVGIGTHVVEWGSNCGNCSTAVALWAADHLGLRSPADGRPLELRMRNLNTDAILTARVAGPGDAEVSVPGVLGGGTAIDLAFESPAGSTTGSLWPTGRESDVLVVDGREVVVTMIDAGAPAVFVDPATLGITPVATESEMRELVPLLRRIRAHAGVAMGLAPSVDVAPDAVPKVGLVGVPADYVTTLGQEIRGEDYDVSVRMLSMLDPHPTIGLTSAVAVAMAARGTDAVLPAAVRDPDRRSLTLGLLGGVLVAEVDGAGTDQRVLLRRAARPLAESSLYLRDVVAVS